MNVAFLSGGSGKRLWPLSNENRSKQFLKLFVDADGREQSMVQRVYEQLTENCSPKRILIATGRSQASIVKNQLGDQVILCIEPCRRDTFPAIALLCAHLLYIEKADEEEAVIVSPVDPYVDAEYFGMFDRLDQAVREGDHELYLLGVEPGFPTEKYGYIVPKTISDDVVSVRCFVEKPAMQKAQELIKEGALWNCGVFAFKLKYVLNKLHEFIQFSSYEEVVSQYTMLPKMSFDYAVVEHETRIGCLRYHGEWKDVGTWNTMAEAMEGKMIGNVILSQDCENTNVINELDIPVLAMGLKDIMVVSSKDGVLVTTKDASSYIKPYVEEIDHRIMYKEKSWGQYYVLYENEDCLVLRLTVRAGAALSYHRHAHRSEQWTVLQGTGTAIVGDIQYPLTPGVTLSLPEGCYHSLEADKQIELIEMQFGMRIDDADKEKRTALGGKI